LKRGYGILSVNGKTVRSAAEAGGCIGGEMSVKLTDGAVIGKITEVMYAGKEKEADA
jgi:hypothetical protein